MTDNGLALDEEGYVYNTDGECIGHLNENLLSESEPAPTDAGKDDGNDDAEDNVHVIDDGDGWVSSLIVVEGDSDCSEASSSSVSSPIMWSWPFASPRPLKIQHRLLCPPMTAKTPSPLQRQSRLHSVSPERLIRVTALHTTMTHAIAAGHSTLNASRDACPCSTA